VGPLQSFELLPSVLSLLLISGRHRSLRCSRVTAT